MLTFSCKILLLYFLFTDPLLQLCLVSEKWVLQETQYMGVAIARNLRNAFGHFFYLTQMSLEDTKYWFRL